MSPAAAVAVARSSPAPAEARPAPATQTQSTARAGAMQNVATPAVSLVPVTRVDASAGGVSGSTGERSWWQRGASWLGDVANGALEFGENVGWRLLNQFAPELVPIIRQGPIEWLKERMTLAIESVFNMLMAPVRPLSGIAASLMDHFTNLLAWIRVAASRIAQGDCGAITEAVEKIQQVFEGIAAPIIDRIKQLTGKVKDFFSGLWERFGAPVWQFLQRLGGQVWEQIQRFGRWIWEKAAPIRKVIGRAWTWVKNKLGIGEGAEGQDGILQWVQRKAQQVWDQHILPFIDRHRRPLMVVAGILVMMSPAGPFIAISAIVGGLIIGIGWIRRNLRSPDGVVNQRDYLRQVIIPGILSATRRVSVFLTEKARLIADRLTQVVGGLNQAVGAIAGSILGFAVAIFEWLLEKFRLLLTWALQSLLRLADWVASALDRLRPFLQKVHDLLVYVLRVASNMMELPMLLAGRVWNAIPACIRDPFVNYFIPLILRQISFFRELVATPEAWSQTRAEVMTLVRQVFRTFDMMGAMRTTFNLLLRVLKVPVDIAMQVWRKANQAWDAVMERPIQFIKNIFLAVGQGFGLFFGNILSHVGYGIQGWLLKSVSDMGIAAPSSWTDLRAVFGFVMDVLGISLNHVIELLVGRLRARGVSGVTEARLRGAVRILTGAWEWVMVALNEGPAGLWRMLVDRLRDLGQMVLESAIGWVMRVIIAQVTLRFTALASSSGLGGIVEAFVALYQAIQTAMEYARRILEIMGTVFDMVLQIARGELGPAAELLERGLHMAMPVVIGFLANYLGLGGIGERIREIISRVRERVDRGILWLIDHALAAGEAVLNMLRRGVAAVLNWWNAKEPISSTDGQQHHIYLDGNENASKLMVASSPMDASEAIKSMKQAKAEPGQIDQAVAFKKTIDDAVAVLVARNSALGTNATPGNKAANDDVISAQHTLMRAAMRGLALLLGETLFGQVKYKDLEDTVITPSSGGSKADMIEAAPLSAKRGMGTPPTADPVGWDAIVEEQLTTNEPRYVRLHLINENFGGRGDYTRNLVPGTSQNNRDHLRTAENQLKDLIGEIPGKQDKLAQVWYKAVVTYRGDNEITWKNTKYHHIKTSNFARTISFKWGLYKHVKAKEWTKESRVMGDFTLGPIPLPKL